MKKRWNALLMCLILTVTLSGCRQNSADVAMDAASTGQEDTFVFTDSAGRKVTLPKEVKKIAPSGPLAQIVLYTACPDQLCGLAADFSEDAKQYIDESYWGLPKFGQFYGKNASLNMEALMAEAPDVIVDIGEAKDTVKEDMDGLQEQLGIPTVFIEATLPKMADAYDMLGELCGNMEQTGKLADYSVEIISISSRIASELSDDEQKKVYFALGNAGLNTNARGSIHADVIEQIGAVNAADVEVVSSGGGSEVSMEQIYMWDPDIIIADSQMLYDKIVSDSTWQELDAVKNGMVYKVPSTPYSFMSDPPSVNRLIGITWLGYLVYPDRYQVDIEEEISEFYKLFYHLDLTASDMEDILRDAV